MRLLLIISLCVPIIGLTNNEISSVEKNRKEEILADLNMNVESVSKVEIITNKEGRETAIVYGVPQLSSKQTCKSWYTFAYRDNNEGYIQNGFERYLIWISNKDLNNCSKLDQSEAIEMLFPIEENTLIRIFNKRENIFREAISKFKDVKFNKEDIEEYLDNIKTMKISRVDIDNHFDKDKKLKSWVYSLNLKFKSCLEISVEIETTSTGEFNVLDAFKVLC
jgi:hypothetical protein